MATRKKQGTVTALAARSRPSVEPYQQLPTVAFADWDRVWQIRNVLVSFENMADFRGASMLMDAMLRDDRINSVSSTRVGAVIAAPWEFKGADSRRKSGKIAEELGGSDDEAGCWEDFCPPAVEAHLSWSGTFLGIGVAEIVWDTSDPENWRPRMVAWDTQFLRWDQALRRYWITTADGDVLLPSIDEQVNSDGRWVIWCPYGYRKSWQRALLRPLGMLYICRQWTYRDWARYSEKHGQPLDKVKVPESAPEDEKSAFRAQVANRGSDGTVFLPQGGKDEPGYDLEIVEAQSKSWEGFQAFLSKLEVSIAVLILGQNLSTEVQEGSRAAAQVQESVRLDKRREDAALAKCLRQQLLYWWALFNKGDADLAPRARKDVDPPEDEKAQVEMMKGVGDAAVALQGAGILVDVDALADYYGIPLQSPEEAAEKELEQQAIAEIAGLPTPPAPGDEPPPEGQGDPPPDDEQDVAQARAQRGRRAASAARRAGKLRGRARPAGDMVKDIGALRDAMAACKSPEELRRRVLRWALTVERQPPPRGEGA